MRLVTSAGIIAARVVKVDAANDLALLKAEGRFAALPVVASPDLCRGWGARWPRSVSPTWACKGSRPRCLRTAKARREIPALSRVQDDARHFQISVSLGTTRASRVLTGALAGQREIHWNHQTVFVANALLCPARARNTAREGACAPRERELRGKEPVGTRSTASQSFSVKDGAESVPTVAESVPEVSAKVLADGHNANTKSVSLRTW